MKRVVLLAAALAAAPIVAQTPAVPDAATLAAARDMMAVTDIQAQLRAMGPRMAEASSQQMRQAFAGQKIPEGLQNQIAAATQSFVGSMDSMFTPQLVDQMATIYARHFTAEELKRLTALLRDPAMVKFRAEMPNTMSEILPLIMTAMVPRQQQFQAQIKQIMTDWIKQHPEDKAKLSSPAAH